MLLAIDVGNTNLKMCLLEMDTGALIGKPERLESKKPDGSTETYDVKTLTECLERLCFVTKRKLTDISFAIYVTVVQNTEAYLQKFLNSFLTSDKFIEVRSRSQSLFLINVSDELLFSRSASNCQSSKLCR